MCRAQYNIDPDGPEGGSVFCVGKKFRPEQT
jgi:hypothetical protein